MIHRPVVNLFLYKQTKELLSLLPQNVAIHSLPQKRMPANGAAYNDNLTTTRIFALQQLHHPGLCILLFATMEQRRKMMFCTERGQLINGNKTFVPLVKTIEAFIE